jgi:hypothetical protein
MAILNSPGIDLVKYLPVQPPQNAFKARSYPRDLSYSNLIYPQTPVQPSIKHLTPEDDIRE